jgi:hypothetical protein
VLRFALAIERGDHVPPAAGGSGNLDFEALFLARVEIDPVTL